MTEATSYVGNVEMTGGPFRDASAAAADEERLAEVIVELIRKNGRMRQAIMNLVLSSSSVEWEL